MTVVYLAGPITGLSYEQCTGWRNEARAHLARRGIRTTSPMRHTRVADVNKPLPATCEDYEHLTGLAVERAVMTRDRFDATNCTLLFANLLGAKRVSLGTAMEIAWADLRRIPIVVAMEPEGNPHDHTMIREAIGFRYDNFEQALECVEHVLGPYRERF